MPGHNLALTGLCQIGRACLQERHKPVELIKQLIISKMRPYTYNIWKLYGI